MRYLELEGVRQNNLKNVSLKLPLGSAIVMTGPSGSGKSSLAFETIYAEGQRRYMQSLSTYARQFLEKFRAPLADNIKHIPPTIALEQLNPVRNSRATVGTTTELYDYLRLLFDKVGIQICSKCQVPMVRQSNEAIFETLKRSFEGSSVLVCFRQQMPKKGLEAVVQRWQNAGYIRLIFANKVYRLDEPYPLKQMAGKEVFWIADRIALEESEELRTRIVEAVEACWNYAEGSCHTFGLQNEKIKSGPIFFRGVRCPKCGKESTPKTATSFSFNNPLGACAKCKGFGNTLEVDLDLVIPNPKLSIAQGAIEPLTKPSLASWQKRLLEFCKKKRIDADLPFRDLPEEQRSMVFDGATGFKGVRGIFAMLEREKYKMRIRVFISRYVSPVKCTQCHGTRLNEEALLVRVGGKNIAEICALTLEQNAQFFSKLSLSAQEEAKIVDVRQQIERRLEVLNTVGLGYLTLSRLSRSLSGGEYQRILLATSLSQGLTDTLYVLDEPSIGLHPKDSSKLMEVLNQLHHQGNSLVVVEHDPELIEWAQYIVDLGPGSGSRGGEVIFSGTQKQFLASSSRTAEAIRTWKEQCRSDLKSSRPKPSELKLVLKGASSHNLKKIHVEIPLGRLVSVTGVSGSGKSTLIVGTLYQALSKMFFGKSDPIGRFESISGFEHLEGVELVDQSPIGRSSRSNPVTFLKAYDEIRKLYASRREAVLKGLTPTHFSFNVPAGRCDKCDGEGRIRVDMVFLEDVWMPCEECQEKRFQKHILEVKYRGKNIDECLRMTVDEAFEHFYDSPQLRSKLSLMMEVGLGYLQLGQPSFTLSGGEAQRLKIAREFSKSISLSGGSTLFILDEPTTGLHFDEITKLIGVLRQLVARGASVLVIEHNVQFVCASDYVIDLGPDGGERGGHVMDVGSPFEVATRKLSYTGQHLSELLREN